MSFIYSLTDTWNAIGTTFKSISMNVSNGAGGAPVGAAASRVVNLQANSVDIFNIDISGNVISGVLSTAIARLSVWSNATATPSALVSTPPAATVGYFANADATTTRVTIDSFGAGIASGLTGRRAQGTAAAPSAILLNDQILNLSGFGFRATGYSGGQVGIVMSAAENWSDTANGTDIIFNTTPLTSTTQGAKGKISANGNWLVGTAALATTAVDGFLHIPTCAGAPTGVPNLTTGLVPMIFDTTNSQFWFYTGGAWKQPKTPAAAAIVTWQ